MKKLLVLALLPLTALCACNKNSGASNKPVDIHYVHFTNRQQVHKEMGKSLTLEAVRGVSFYEKGAMDYQYLMEFSTTHAEFNLNYKITGIRQLDIEFGEPFESIKVTHIYVDLYENKNDSTPIYTFGGEKQLKPYESRKALLKFDDFSEHVTTDAYMFIRFEGTGEYTQNAVSIAMYDLVVTSK